MFFQWFFSVGPLVSMVFPMVFPFETMVSQWFFTVGPLVSMVFPMVSYSGNIGLNGLEKASDGHQWFTEKRLFIVNMAPVSEI